MPGPYSSLMHATPKALSRFAERGEIEGHRHRRARWSIHSGQKTRHSGRCGACRKHSGEARDRLWRSGSRPPILFNAQQAASTPFTRHLYQYLFFVPRCDHALTSHIRRETGLGHAPGATVCVPHTPRPRASYNLVCSHNGGARHSTTERRCEVAKRAATACACQDAAGRFGTFGTAPSC